MPTDLHVLFLFAHQDDEVAAAPRIALEVADGNVVHCAYLTDGETRGVSSATRCAESSRVLRSLGRESIDVAFIGTMLKIGDGELASNLARAFAKLLEWIGTWDGPPSRLYFLAWEGGHHDHDAVHIVGLALKARYESAIAWQFPLYNGHDTIGRLFRVLHPLPAWGPPKVTRLSLRQGIRYAALCSQYPSQWRTWLGLSPGIVFRYILQRRHNVYPVDPEAIAFPPHGGKLLYERMFGVDREYVLSSTASVAGPISSRLPQFSEAPN